ncbi:MAG TPA: Rieske 2Fe-2S domain-containing protein, partial [Acidimicrobiales bacterium]
MTVLNDRPPAEAARALVQPDRVHGSVYTSTEVFEREMERIFTDGWVFVAHESELPQPGDYVTRRIGRQSVIVSRAKDGSLHVLSNRCTHRGNRICNAEAG